MKEVLIYLVEQAEGDQVVGEFDEDGEWGLAIDDIKNHLLELEK